MDTVVLKEITNQEFIEKYKPVCNNRFPTTLLQGSILHPYAYQRDEYAQIAHFSTERRFFSVEISPDGQSDRVIPGLHNGLNIRGYIVTDCQWRPENLEYTIVQYLDSII